VKLIRLISQKGAYSSSYADYRHKTNAAMFGTWVALEEAVNERNETMEGNKKLEYG
jgi:hypothetical protein